jgi:hypothetical protein
VPKRKPGSGRPGLELQPHREFALLWHFFETADPSYNLPGNAIQLWGDVLNQSGTNLTISLNIQLVSSDGAFDQGVFDTGAMKIADSASITVIGMTLARTGSSALVLSGSNNYSADQVDGDGSPQQLCGFRRIPCW